MVLLLGGSRLHHGVGIVYQENRKPFSFEVARNHLTPDLSNV